MSDQSTAKNDPLINSEQQALSIRVALIMLGTSIATKYGFDQNLVPAIVGLAIALGSAAYSFYRKSNTGLIQAAATVPRTIIVTDAKIADASPDNVHSSEAIKVVTS